MDVFKALCEICGEMFTLKKNLYAHLRRIHDVKETKEKGESCVVCDKLFANVAALDQHMKVHTAVRDEKVLCTECEFGCSNRSDLRSHLRTVHGVQIEERVLEFDSMEQFSQWKAKMEEEEKASFVKYTGSKSSGNRNTDYYDCHRSGNVRRSSLGQRLRGPSVKIGRTCPAALVVTSTLDRVTVKFYATHTGHSLSLSFMRLTEADREMVASLIKEGVSDGFILKNVRESVVEGEFKRLHLLEKRDIWNIKKEFKLDLSSAHENDAVSVHLWVEQQKHLGADSSVIFYKQQGTEDEMLSKDDFMLVIMTPFQLELAKEFVGDKVLIDSTHATNKYNFLLTTLMTVDEFGMGCPVAYCLSTRTDKVSMTVFLNAVKQHTGVIKTKVFMSDDCNSYYNAWNVVMGPSQHRLLCTWHVDQSWTRNIRSKIKDTIAKCNIYKVLKILQFETNREKFTEMLEGFLQWCAEDIEMHGFGTYFDNEYAKRPEMWAYCYRVGLGLNTNMYLEALHKILKHCYFASKVNNRVDKCIQALLHRTRDFAFERAIRLVKGGLTSGRISRISKSHKRSCEITDQMVTSVEDGKWHVMCPSSDLPYTVATTGSSCPGCPLKCHACNVCVHQYICSCVDHLIKGNMCKHIHAIVRQEGTGEPHTQESLHRESSLQAVTERAVLRPLSVSGIVNVQAAMHERSVVLQQMLRNVDVENASTVIVSLDRLISQVGKIIASQKDKSEPGQLAGPQFPAAESAPSNKKYEKQNVFYSVKKGCAKRSRISTDPAEITEIQEALLSRSSAENDHTYV